MSETYLYAEHHMVDKSRCPYYDSEIGCCRKSEVPKAPKAPLIKTNGDVFKEMFPDAKIACQETLAVAGLPHYRVVAEIDWWNAPYKGEEA